MNNNRNAFFTTMAIGELSSTWEIIMFEELKGMRIAWIIPSVNRGSGGLQTIFRHASFLQEHGALCDIQIAPGFPPQTQNDLSELLVHEYDCNGCDIHAEYDDSISYDVVIATMWLTVPYALRIQAKTKLYFVQDYEPWFYPMGDDFLLAKNTYDENIEPITIGKWLSNKLLTEHGKTARFTDFCADSTIYRPLGLSEEQKERAVCAVFQPDKPRRCTRLLIDTLTVLHQLDETIVIYTFGSPSLCPELDSICSHLGILSKSKCNELYNRCLAGLSLSASNPSRIPFEMMASGLPTVDLYLKNNILDLGSSPAILASPTPDAIATALFELVQDRKRNLEISKQEVKFMSNRPISLETEQFASALLQICTSNSDKQRSRSLLTYSPREFRPSRQAERAYCEIKDHKEKHEMTNQRIALRELARIASSSSQNLQEGIVRRLIAKMRSVLN